MLRCVVPAILQLGVSIWLPPPPSAFSTMSSTFSAFILRPLPSIAPQLLADGANFSWTAG